MTPGSISRNGGSNSSGIGGQFAPEYTLELINFTESIYFKKVKSKLKENNYDKLIEELKNQLQVKEYKTTINNEDYNIIKIYQELNNIAKYRLAALNCYREFLRLIIQIENNNSLSKHHTELILNYIIKDILNKYFEGCDLILSMQENNKLYFNLDGLYDKKLEEGKFYDSEFFKLYNYITQKPELNKFRTRSSRMIKISDYM